MYCNLFLYQIHLYIYFNIIFYLNLIYFYSNTKSIYILYQILIYIFYISCQKNMSLKRISFKI
jgi:hypothetical protein